MSRVAPRSLTQHAKDLTSIIRLLASGTIATSKMAQDLQQRIDRPFRKSLPLLGHVTNLVYGSVRAMAALTGGAASLCEHGLADANESNDADAGSVRERLLSALNGVLGDQLHAANNQLAIPMQLRGLPITSGEKTYALFIHGLCMTDADWLDDAHPAAVRAAGYTPIFLRYNTGLAIAENGAKLAVLMHDVFGADAQSDCTIVCVAHSMGGLVWRHALHVARQREMPWRLQITAQVYLGTPHLGAPLERAGHWLAQRWSALPFAAALSPIANVRSLGIQDLHSGVSLPFDQAKSYFVAGCLRETSKSDATRLLGDGLVPISSALAGQSPDACHVLFHQVGHMDLLHAPAVSLQLQAWLCQFD